jgi:hypothetical protein
VVKRDGPEMGDFVGWLAGWMDEEKHVKMRESVNDVA